MRELQLAGARRGKKKWRTTYPDTMTPRLADLVNRQFTASAPNRLWMADLTYVSTWQAVCYAAFIADVLSRYIVGWRVALTLRTDLVLDALEQAIRVGSAYYLSGLVHHSDRGRQYLSIRYTERLVDLQAVVSVGSRCDSYDNALVESVIGLFKTEVVKKERPGGRSTSWNWRPRAGSSGRTSAASTARSATCRRQSSRPPTMPNWTAVPSRESKPQSLQKTRGDSK